MLDLSYNSSITIRGWTVLSTLLEMPDTNLERLIINNNIIGDGGAQIFANALRVTANSKLWIGHSFQLFFVIPQVSKQYIYLESYTLKSVHRSSEDKGKIAMRRYYNTILISIYNPALDGS